MLDPLPPWPDVPPEQRATSDILPRYEDLSQDGRLHMYVLGPLYGETMWRGVLNHGPVAEAARSQGIFAILNRLVLCIDDGPFSPWNPFHVEGVYDLAHTADASGEPDRLLLRLWARVHGPQGSVHEPSAPDAPRLLAGRVYAEHVFTRLFAPPGERKVLRLDLPGLPPVPPTRAEIPPPSSLLALPPGAEPLDPALEIDPEVVAFSLGQTDSNQHVNSLVYPRLFELLTLRRLARRGVSTRLLLRRAECAYRKPSFAGDTARFAIQTFRLGAGHGAVGMLLPGGEGLDGKPSVTMRIWLGP